MTTTTELLIEQPGVQLALSTAEDAMEELAACEAALEAAELALKKARHEWAPRHVIADLTNTVIQAQQRAAEASRAREATSAAFQAARFTASADIISQLDYAAAVQRLDLALEAAVAADEEVRRLHAAAIEAHAPGVALPPSMFWGRRNLTPEALADWRAHARSQGFEVGGTPAARLSFLVPIIRFLKRGFEGYHIGEVAGVHPAEAPGLVDQGFAHLIGEAEAAQLPAKKGPGARILRAGEETRRGLHAR